MRTVGDKKLTEPEAAPRCAEYSAVAMAIPILKPEDPPPCSLQPAEQRGLI